MTLNQMIYFQKIAETENMGRATEALHISQPSLSISVANLEKELNLKLFHHNGHRIALSHEGKQLLSHVNKILSEVQETQLHMQSLSSDRNTHIRIGCISPVLQNFLPPYLHDFLALEKNRHLKVDFTTDNTLPLLEKLRNGYCDFLICSEAEAPDIIQNELLSEPYVLLCPPNTDIPETWEDLLSRNMIGFHVRAASHHEIHTMLIRHGIQPTYLYRAPDEESIAALVAQGFGFGIVPRVGSLDSFSIQIAPLPEPNQGMVRKLYISQLADRPPVGASRNFLSYLMAAQKQNKEDL